MSNINSESYKFSEPLTSDDLHTLMHIIKRNSHFYDTISTELKRCNKCGKIGHTTQLFSQGGVVDFEHNRQQCKDCRRIYKQEFYEQKKKKTRPAASPPAPQASS